MNPFRYASRRQTAKRLIVKSLVFWLVVLFIPVLLLKFTGPR